MASGRASNAQFWADKWKKATPGPNRDRFAEKLLEVMEFDVKYKASRAVTYYCPLPDCEQVARLSIVTSLESYDNSTEFRTWAIKNIEYALQKFKRDHGGALTQSAAAYESLTSGLKKVEEVEATTGAELTSEDITQMDGLTDKERYMLTHRYVVLRLSLPESNQDGEGGGLVELASTERGYGEVESESLLQDSIRLIEGLPDKQLNQKVKAIVLTWLKEPELSQREICEKLGVSDSYVSFSVKKAREILRGFYAERI